MNTMTDKNTNNIKVIKEIAEKVKLHRELEINTETVNKAVARSLVMYDNEVRQFWIILKSANRVCQYDFNGNIIPDKGHIANKPYESDGFCIPRDSKLGALLVQNHKGKHIHKIPKGETIVEIYNRVIYTPSEEYDIYATDIAIKLSEYDDVYRYRNIMDIFELNSEIVKEKSSLDIEKEEDIINKQHVESIEKNKKAKKELKKKAQFFIRKYAELRFQPILDPIQDEIRRSEIFNNILIINGGPGTGKTTSLIQRIKYLTSPTIEEVYKLTEKQRDVLYNQKKSWLFYSPNELLALFLRSSMLKEELEADDDRVRVWATHKLSLVKQYKLVDIQTKNPFMIYTKAKGQPLFINTPTVIKKIYDLFQNSYLELQKEKIDKIIKLDVNQFYWKNTGKSIINFISDRGEINTTKDYIRLFYNLNNSYKDESNEILTNYNKLVEDVASKIQVGIEVNSDKYNKLQDLFQSWETASLDIEEEEDLDKDSEEYDVESEYTDFTGKLFSKIKAICRKLALKQYDTNVKLTKRDNKLRELIPEVIDQAEYLEIGQMAYFKKYFERLIKGISSNILREIPRCYKKFRKEQLKQKNKDFDIKILTELVGKDKNKRIHPDEQALLLLCINKICVILATNFSNYYDEQTHSYLDAFKDNCKPVIGIDEAADFSIIDILAMSSFGHPSLSSVTLCGDVMQRMTVGGINSWEDLTKLSNKFVRKDLQVSYRQSPTLLSLARKIFKESTGEEATYTSFIAKDETEPQPLLLVSDDEDEKLEWISSRIMEIYEAYEGSIPSIAIFLPNENLLETFANQLGSIDKFADVAISVKACRNGEVLGDKDTIRVFSIDKIKGLEFEAVFFHDLDSLENGELSDDLVLKYLYVGLSRATFYLGLTMNEEFSEDLKFLETSFDSSGKTWKI